MRYENYGSFIFFLFVQQHIPSLFVLFFNVYLKHFSRLTHKKAAKLMATN